MDLLETLARCWQFGGGPLVGVMIEPTCTHTHTSAFEYLAVTSEKV